MSEERYTPSGPSKVWSVIVDYLADDARQAMQRRNEIAAALEDMEDRIGATATSTPAEVMPLVQFEEDDDGL